MVMVFLAAFTRRLMIGLRQVFSVFLFGSFLHSHFFSRARGGDGGGAVSASTGVVTGAGDGWSRVCVNGRELWKVRDGVCSALVSNSIGVGTRTLSFGQTGAYALGKRRGNCGSGCLVGVGVDVCSPGKFAATGCGTMTGTGLSSRGVSARAGWPTDCPTSDSSRPCRPRRPRRRPGPLVTGSIPDCPA